MTSAARTPSSKPQEIRPPGSRPWPWFAGAAWSIFSAACPRGPRVEMNPAAIHYSEIKLISPFHHTPRFIREAMEAIRRGDILSHDFITEEIRLADLPNAFARMKLRSGEIKLAVRP